MYKVSCTNATILVKLLVILKSAIAYITRFLALYLKRCSIEMDSLKDIGKVVLNARNGLMNILSLPLEAMEKIVQPNKLAIRCLDFRLIICS